MARFLVPDGWRLRWLALLPDPQLTTDSSLAYMVGRAATELARGVDYCVDGNGVLDLERAIELSPTLIPGLFNRGALRYSQGDLQGAKEDFDRCIAADPHLPAPTPSTRSRSLSRRCTTRSG